MEKFKITTTFPTPLLQDFHTYLDYLMQHQPLVLTTKSGHLPPTVLAPLNALMQCANKGGNSPKSKQTRCYLLHLFFHLVLDGGLCTVVPHGKAKRILEPNLEAIQRFTNLNPTEQYIYLLKTLLVDIPTEVLSVTRSWQGISAHGIANVFALLFNTKWHNVAPELVADIAKAVFIQRIPDMMEYALYLSWFGFWEVTINEKQPYINIVKEAQLTELGLAMAEVLHHERRIDLWNNPYQEEWLEDLRFEYQIARRALDEVAVVADREKATAAPFFLAFVPLFEEGLLREDSFDGLFN